MAPPEPYQPPPGLALVFADSHLLVFDKPSGLLSVPGRGPGMHDCLSARALAQYPDALVVHRLDMATSGLLLMARQPAVQRQLGAAFAQGQVHKSYVAVVQGRPEVEEGIWWEINLPIQVDWARRPLRSIDANGQASRTRVQLQQWDASTQSSRLALQPLTGRTHQLRVHLQAVGHPILGDRLYAPAPVAAAAPRLLLHAQCLQLQHPQTGAALEFLCPAPF